MNNTVVVSCFYTNLHGTNYGGRPGRHHHYLHSLASLLKITNADFIIYCDPSQKQELKSFIEPIAKTKVDVIGYSLENFYMKDLFSKHKDTNEARASQRCQEIQYLKTYWMNKIKGYEYIFWIDAGISYSGLIPYKNLISQNSDTFEYYNSDLFCNDLVCGMKKAAQDKFLLFAINNHYPVLYRKLLEDYYDKDYDDITHHAIAGILGGTKNMVHRFQNLFDEQAKDVIKNTNSVCDEESIYDILLNKHANLFNLQKFDMWWHEDNLHSIYEDDPETVEKVKHLKSFYNTLEDLIKLGKQS